jgi:hypothetical protein
MREPPLNSDLPPAIRPESVVLPAPPQQLTYDKSAPHVTRRQMNLLLLFVFINTLLFAAFVCLPTASPYLKQMWADYEKRRDDRRRLDDLRAKFDACLNHTEAPDRVLYAEPAADAAKLLATDPRALPLARAPQLTREGSLVYHDARRDEAVINWITLQRIAPTHATCPPPLAALLPSLHLTSDVNHAAIPFLHAMKRPDGAPRLVVVTFDASQSVRRLPRTSDAPADAPTANPNDT